MGGIITLKAELFVNDQFIPLNDFNQAYAGNILKGIAASLGYSGREFGFYFDSGELKIYSNGAEVEIKKDFVRLIVRNTIRGMLSSLKGVSSSPENITIKASE